MMLLICSLIAQADPWGRPEHLRIAREPLQDWTQIYSSSWTMRLWWDGATPATVERLYPSGWKTIATNVQPGWITPALKQPTELRVRINGAVRCSEPITLEPIIRPIDFASISASGGSQLATTVGELAPLGNGFLGGSFGGGLISEDHTKSRWDGLLSDYVLAIATAGSTHLIGTADGVQLWIDGAPTRSWSRQNYPHIFASDYIQALAIGPKHYWVGTYRGLIAIPKKALDKPELVIGDYSVFSLLAQRDGTVWAGMNGVTRINEEWNSEQQSWPKQVYDLAYVESARGSEVLMATTARGVVSISDSGNKVISTLEATSLIHDGKSVWVAAGPKGLWRGETQKLTDVTWSLLHHRGRLFAGTENGIIELTGGEHSTQVPIAPLAVGQSVEDLLVLKKGTVVISNQQLICLGQCPTLPNTNAIRVIEVNNEIWVLGRERLYRPKQSALEIPGKTIDAQWWRNKLWVATDQGLYRLETDTWELHSDKGNWSQLQSNSHSMWGVDNNGLIWNTSQQDITGLSRAGKALSVAPSGLSVCVGTSDGIVRYWRARTPTIEDVLGDADLDVAITAVAGDDSGGCWVAGEDGSIGHIDIDGNARWSVLPIEDPPQIRRLIPERQAVWVLSDKGLWRIPFLGVSTEK